MTTPGQEEKRYDPRDTTLKFVNRPDDLDPLPPEEGDVCLRAEMSCGHAVTPESLTGWCRSLLDQCPGCNTYVERDDFTDLKFQCTICVADKKPAFQFCWQCLKPWKGRAPRSDRCDNDGCVNHDLEILKICKTTSLPEVQGVDTCPSIRACPTCGQRVEHDKTGCKNIICPRCQVEFCFVCLKLTPDCLETSSYFLPCTDGVAPRQTSIPVWHRD
ncbi:probable E3 ubiquitin-protein ligase RNF144A-A isoform X3 [Centroberyx affinis]|uniref:probable E3 ubiquitin-protein ligase RNF144A-A isoform X3 n=1 Tax=Centroberyx affinis TaxID=166261 RepID=UPI003A5C3B8E